MLQVVTLDVLTLVASSFMAVICACISDSTLVMSRAQSPSSASSGGFDQTGSLKVIAVASALVRLLNLLLELRHRGSPGGTRHSAIFSFCQAQALMWPLTVLQLLDPQSAHIGQTRTM